MKTMRHYARGEALAGRGDAAGVLAEAAAIRGAPSGDISAIAAAVLEGRAAMLKGDPASAAKAFETAAATQERVYAFSFDPPPWWYPVRRSVAAAELKAGRADEAMRAAEQSLKIWPQDALTLQVLAQAHAKLGQAAEARERRAQAERAWRGNAKMPALDLI